MKNNRNTTNVGRIILFYETCMFILLVICMVSCVKTETSAYRHYVALHPPAWIQGNWVSEQRPDVKFKFLYNDVVVVDGTGAKSYVNDILFIYGLNDSCSDTSYIMNYDETNYQTQCIFKLKNGKLLFTKLRGNKIIVSEETYIR